MAWAAVVAMPGMVMLSSCVQDLPVGSPPQPDSGDAAGEAPPEDHTAGEESPDAPLEAGSDAGEDISADVSDAASPEADAGDDVVDTGVVPDSGEGGDATGVGDASDASNASDASDATSTSDASDASSANDASDAGLDGSVSPCALVQSSDVCQAATSCTMSLPGSTTPGDLLVLVFAVGASVTPSTPSGWTQAIVQSGTGESIGIWYYPNVPAGVTSVTMSGGGTNSVRGIISEWSNVTKVDQFASFSTTSSKSLTVSTPGGIAGSGECAISAFGEKHSLAQAVLFAAGNGWTHLTDSGSSGTNYQITSDYQLSPPLGVVSETQSSNVSGDWVGAIVTFR